MNRQVRYRSDIDGLRAVAVGSVVFFHAGVPGLSGGFAGVDVFFVISGYLITGIIAREATQGRFTIGGFYLRRVRRIFPALFAMIAAVAAVASVLLMPADYTEFCESVGATALFASNIFFWLKSGYFDASAELKPLLHTWSLAVEEQYYLVFPLLMVFLIKRVRRWRAAIAALAAASFILALWEVGHAPTQAFYSPLSRAWELLIGALVAVGAAPALRSVQLREAAAVLGLVLIAGSVALLKSTTPFPGLGALAPCLGAALLIHAGAAEPTAVGRLLSTRPMVGLGLVSYSLYLWHWPVLVFARYVLMRPLGGWEMVAAMATGLFLAIQSWRWVERPFRHGASSRPRIFAVATVTMALAVAFGLAGWLTHGWPQRLPAPSRALAQAALDVNADRAACDRPSPARVRSGAACVRGDISASAATFALLGDSFGDAEMPAVAQAAQEAGRKGLMFTYSGCLPLAGVRGELPLCAGVDEAIAAIRRTPSIDRVIIVARWSAFVTGERFGSWSQTISLADAQTSGASAQANRDVMERAFARTIRALAPRRVFVVAFLPEQRVDVPRAAALSRRLGPLPPIGVTRDVYDARQAPARAFLSAQASKLGFTLLDAGPWLCDSNACPAVRDGVVLYADDNHVSRTAAVMTRGLFAPALAPAGPASEGLTAAAAASARAPELRGRTPPPEGAKAPATP